MNVLCMWTKLKANLRSEGIKSYKTDKHGSSILFTFAHVQEPLISIRKAEKPKAIRLLTDSNYQEEKGGGGHDCEGSWSVMLVLSWKLQVRLLKKNDPNYCNKIFFHFISHTKKVGMRNFAQLTRRRIWYSSASKSFCKDASTTPQSLWISNQSFTQQDLSCGCGVLKAQVQSEWRHLQMPLSGPRTSPPPRQSLLEQDHASVSAMV